MRATAKYVIRYIPHKIGGKWINKPILVLRTATFIVQVPKPLQKRDKPVVRILRPIKYVPVHVPIQQTKKIVKFPRYELITDYIKKVRKTESKLRDLKPDQTRLYIQHKKYIDKKTGIMFNKKSELKGKKQFFVVTVPVFNNSTNKLQLFKFKVVHKPLTLLQQRKLIKQSLDEITNKIVPTGYVQWGGKVLGIEVGNLIKVKRKK